MNCSPKTVHYILTYISHTSNLERKIGAQVTKDDSINVALQNFRDVKAVSSWIPQIEEDTTYNVTWQSMILEVF